MSESRKHSAPNIATTGGSSLLSRTALVSYGTFSPTSSNALLLSESRPIDPVPAGSAQQNAAQEELARRPKQ